MKKTLRLAGLVLAVAASATVARAATYNLGELVRTGGSVTIGDKIFDDFSFASNGFDPIDATVTPSIDASGVYYLSFQGPWVSTLGASGNIALNYTVATTSGNPTIYMIDQSYILGVGGTGGTISIEEEAHTGGFNGPIAANSSLGFASGLPPSVDLEDPIAEPTDDLIVDPVASKLWIVTDIHFSAERFGIIGPTTIVQSFHQQTSVADAGSTAAMFGIALFSIGLIRRKTA